MSETNIVTQENLDNYLFKDLKSISPTYIKRTNDDISGDIRIYYADKGNIIIRRRRLIGTGAYGEVFEYSTDDTDPIKYAVKISHILVENEKKAILKLKSREMEQKGVTNSQLCIIPGKRVFSKDTNVSIMPLMDGDLVQFVRNFQLSLKILTQICNDVRGQLQCILNLNKSNEIVETEKDILIEFAYMDLRADNVLYKENKDGTYKFLIGDIGSIIPIEDKKDKKGPYYTTNKPCLTEMCSKSNKVYVSDHNIISCMRYVFGIFCCSLFIDIDIFDNSLSIQERHDLSLKLTNLLGPTYENLLYDEYPETRVTMY